MMCAVSYSGRWGTSKKFVAHVAAIRRMERAAVREAATLEEIPKIRLLLARLAIQLYSASSAAPPAL